MTKKMDQNVKYGIFDYVRSSSNEDVDVDKRVRRRHARFLNPPPGHNYIDSFKSDETMK